MRLMFAHDFAIHTHNFFVRHFIFQLSSICLFYDFRAKSVINYISKRADLLDLHLFTKTKIDFMTIELDFEI